MPKLFPASLSPEVSRPLLAEAERIARVAPWEFMSDLELLGMRDEATGRLHVASILGTLGTMFAVVIYRNDAGLRWIHDMATNRRVPDPDAGLEDMDCLKIEWCRKKELQKSDLNTLAAAGFKPKGQGPVWPRFESTRPGWYPWGVTDVEARLMTELLRKVARFVCLREKSRPLHKEPLEALVPIIPAGEESTLRAEDIEWLPFVPPPAPLPEPVALSACEQESLLKLPIRHDSIVEIVAPLTPTLAFVDEKEGRPCLARATIIVDRATHYVLCAKIAHGAAPLRDATGPALTEAFRNAKSRPERIHVDNARLAATLRPTCEAIRVPLCQAPLEAAPSAWAEFEEHFSHQRPR
ncbi:MAG TPA: hypothetical protein VJA21_29345 [Verrucomicrobiae bacterium]